MNFSDLPVDENAPMYLFIPEVIELQGIEHPVALGNYARLCRLGSPKKEQLRHLLDPYIQAQQLRGVNPWEFDRVPVAPGQTQIVPHADPLENKFWVIEYWRKLVDHELQLALELADPGLTPLLAVNRLYGPSMRLINNHAIINWLELNYLTESTVIGSGHVQGIVDAFNLLTSFFASSEPTFEFIRQALRKFEAMKDISRRNPLYVVGLVSIIESLLTTPQEGKTDNSLSHQLKAKLTLFNNRLPIPIDLGKYFPGGRSLEIRTVVGKLYNYRSDIAHGNSSNFSKELAVLESHDAVCKFLHTLIRHLLLQAVREPSLVRDIKSC